MKLNPSRLAAVDERHASLLEEFVECFSTAPRVSEVAIAVTEACANVIEHSSDDDDDYEVRVAVNERLCEIRVIDTGRDGTGVPPFVSVFTVGAVVRFLIRENLSTASEAR